MNDFVLAELPPALELETKSVLKQALDTISLIAAIRELMGDYKHRIREQYKFYSQDLLNNLFCHPYTKIEFLERDLGVTRQTASKYLDELSLGGFLFKEKVGNHNFYINEPLFALFAQG
jgi:Fic family protein